MGRFLPIIKWELLIKKLLLVFLFPLFTLYPDNSQNEEPVYETNVTFHGFSWGTSMETVIQRMGRPVSREEVNGLVSLVWENVEVGGYMTYMLGYFSRSGLEGGTYYFLTHDMDELMRCYTEMRQSLRDRFGPTALFMGIIKEMLPFECSWKLPGGYVHLKVNTRVGGDPVTLWFSSPALTRQVLGEENTSTARR